MSVANNRRELEQRLRTPQNGIMLDGSQPEAHARTDLLARLESSAGGRSPAFGNGRRPRSTFQIRELQTSTNAVRGPKYGA